MCAIAMLSCIFALSAYADGDIHAGRTSAPGQVSTTTSETSGEISYGVKQVLFKLILSLL